MTERIYDENFMVVTVSRDGRQVGINHPTEADWNDVLQAHIGLRDRLNERIAEQEKCPLCRQGGWGPHTPASGEDA